MRSILQGVLSAAVLVLATACSADSEPLAPPPAATPPFAGTIFIDPDIITSSDPTTLRSMSHTGQGPRTMFDRRVGTWVTVDAFLFDASYDDGLSVEIQVNPEFGTSDAALAQATKYAEVIGRLPTALRDDVATVWIHMGTEPFGGGNDNLLIHVGQADLYAASGILEETLVHEAAHTSLDATHAAAAGWLAAQRADGVFISTYARDHPGREDIAESFLPWLAVRHRSGRISGSLADRITQAIPNRLGYFDDQSFEMYPILPRVSGQQAASRCRTGQTEAHHEALVPTTSETGYSCGWLDAPSAARYRSRDRRTTFLPSDSTMRSIQGLQIRSNSKGSSTSTRCQAQYERR